MVWFWILTILSPFFNIKEKIGFSKSVDKVFIWRMPVEWDLYHELWHSWDWEVSISVWIYVSDRPRTVSISNDNVNVWDVRCNETKNIDNTAEKLGKFLFSYFSSIVQSLVQHTVEELGNMGLAKHYRIFVVGLFKWVLCLSLSPTA